MVGRHQDRRPDLHGGHDPQFTASYLRLVVLKAGAVPFRTAFHSAEAVLSDSTLGSPQSELNCGDSGNPGGVHVPAIDMQCLLRHQNSSNHT